MKGVYRTRVGYTGGQQKFPTYHSLGTHTEALQIDFDPAQISFADVVGLFWDSHDPRSGIRSTQYMAAIWFHDAAQREVIHATSQAVEARLQTKVRTPVMPLDVFYSAEDYHQKYRLQNSPLKTYFRTMYPQFEDFNRSTAAARLNGFIAGHGSRTVFDDEHSQYGVPPEELRQLIRLRAQPEGCSLPRD